MDAVATAEEDCNTILRCRKKFNSKYNYKYADYLSYLGGVSKMNMNPKSLRMIAGVAIPDVPTVNKHDSWLQKAFYNKLL